MQSDSAVIFSGGLDSTTLVYDLLHSNYEPHLISFNYGQRHKKELDYAVNTAFRLGLRHDIIDLSGITHLISNSALTSVERDIRNKVDGIKTIPGSLMEAAKEIEVPEGHYAEDNMKATVVPNRNMMMISIASAIAVSNEYKEVFTGVHAGDHFVYPDCRPRFINAVNAAVVLGNDGFGPIPEQPAGAYPSKFVQAPFMYLTKTQIAAKAFELEVPLEETWSCYKGGDLHCGKCGTCVERLEAIHDASVALHGDKAADRNFFDNTRYEDNTFWREAIANARS
jgi:7-cyano-7-deazaguanine synthase